MTTPHPTDAPPAPADLDALAALCAAFPGPYELEIEESAPEWEYGDTYEYPAAISGEGFRVELIADPGYTPDLEALIAKANAVPTLLAELTLVRADATALRNEREATEDMGYREWLAIQSIAGYMASYMGGKGNSLLTVEGDITGLRRMCATAGDVPAVQEILHLAERCRIAWEVHFAAKGATDGR